MKELELLVYTPSGVVLELDNNILDDIYYEFDHIIEYDYNRLFYYINDIYIEEVNKFIIYILLNKFFNSKGDIKLIINKKTWGFVAKTLNRFGMKWENGADIKITDFDNIYPRYHDRINTNYIKIYKNNKYPIIHVYTNNVINITYSIIDYEY